MALVLVVDDDRRIRDLVEGFLQSDDVEVECVDDGADAIRKLKTGSYSLVLLDLMMPGLSGFVVLDFLRTERPEMVDRVVVMTGRNVGDDKKICTIDFRGRLLKKPFSQKQLHSRVDRFLR